MTALPTYVTGGWVCQACGQTVPYQTTHYCPSWQTNPAVPQYIPPAPVFLDMRRIETLLEEILAELKHRAPVTPDEQ